MGENRSFHDGSSGKVPKRGPVFVGFTPHVFNTDFVAFRCVANRKTCRVSILAGDASSRPPGAPRKIALDFACGSHALLSFTASDSRSIIEIAIGPLKRLTARQNSLLESQRGGTPGGPPTGVDLAVALPPSCVAAWPIIG